MQGAKGNLVGEKSRPHLALRPAGSYIPLEVLQVGKLSVLVASFKLAHLPSQSGVWPE